MTGCPDKQIKIGELVICPGTIARYHYRQPHGGFGACLEIVFVDGAGKTFGWAEAEAIARHLGQPIDVMTEGVK